jgi:microcystin-dependent protein
MADGSQPLIGSIMMFAGNFAPKNFMLCQGQILSIAQNTALFSILGTTYGGNGQTTFALPDLRGRGPVNQGPGPGLSPVDLGEVTGSSQVTVLSGQLPIHNHPINADTTGYASQQSPGNAYWSQQGDPANQVNAFSAGARNANMSPTMCGISGGNQPLPVQNPILALNFIICIYGVFPSRN